MSEPGILDQPPEEFTYEDYRPQMNQNLMNLALIGAVMAHNAYRRGAFETENKQFKSESAAARKKNTGLGLYKGAGKDVTTSGKDLNKLSKSASVPNLKKGGSSQTLVNSKSSSLGKLSQKALSKTASVAQSMPELKASLKSLQAINTKTKGSAGTKIRAAINKVDKAATAAKIAVQTKSKPLIQAAKQKISAAKMASKAAVKDISTTGGSSFRDQLEKNIAKVVQDRASAKNEAWKGKMVKKIKTTLNTAKLGPVLKNTKTRSVPNLSRVPKAGGMFGSTPNLR